MEVGGSRYYPGEVAPVNPAIGTGSLAGAIGVHYTSKVAAFLIISSRKLNPMSWVQPFPATPDGLNQLTGFLLGGGLGTGAIGKDQTFIFDIRGMEVAPGGLDVNGGVKLKDEVPLTKLIAPIDDSGAPDKVDEAILKVKAYFGIP